MTHVSYSVSNEKNGPVQQLIPKILSDFSRDYNLDLSQDPIAMDRIREAVEKARLELDTAYQTEINLPYISANASGPIHLIRVVTREDMNQQTLESEGSGEGHVKAQLPFRIKLPDRKPLVTYSLMGITIAFYLLQLLTQLLMGFDLPAAFGLKINESIVAGQVWRLITPMFLHGSILHLGFNMYALFILGRRVERFFGSFRYLGLYVIAGITGNVFSFFFTPSPSLGSSTAIFGILGAEAVFIYQHRYLFGDQSKVALRQIIQVAVINLLIGLSPSIDNWGHIGGLIGGSAFSWFAGPQFLVQGSPPLLYLEDERKERTTGIIFVLQMIVLIGLVVLIIQTRL
ncbi:MAG: rhomboid family intramembrane serine protease [Anaerolineales bacterium]|nr:rhomboid family intramembrane serine protease [Anaerolineales bacterium]